MKKDTLQQQLDELRKEYGRKLPEKVEQIEGACRAWKEGRWNLALLKEFYLLTHTLAGSSGSFGYTALSNTAHTMEIYLKNLHKNRDVPTEVQQTQILHLVGQLKEGINQPDQAPNPVIDTTVDSQKDSRDSHLVFLVDDDGFHAKGLALQIGHFGYSVEVFNSLTDFQKAIEKTTPSVLIMDVSFPEGLLAGIEAVAEQQNKRENPLPVIFISANGDLDSRLQAVRAGGKAYLTKPFGIEELIDKVDLLSSPHEPDPLRILIVEDERDTAIQYALTLQQAGMMAEVITEPEKAIDFLAEFKPDLVVMDMYMSINGLELAMVIRQHESFMSLPIVFVSTETNLDKHMLTIGMGVDAFLPKPIKPHHLILTVRSRAHRARFLNSLVVRDSLTGLFNHTATRERLNLEVSRVRREKGTLVFAMLDLDNFKSVNDNHGHLMGDRVIKSLSRLLKQRLRKTDILGRYGGEEFAILLPNTTVEDAARVLNEIRRAFGNISYSSEGKTFCVTFSCGIASTDQYDNPTELNDGADKALYRAKSAGRNRVEVD